MKRNTWLGFSLAAALALAGAAVAQDRNRTDDPTKPDPNKSDQYNKDQQKPGQNIGMTGKIDEQQVKQVFQQKDYLKGLSITPRIEGDKVVLTGNVPSKAHLIAAILAVYELPSVKHVDCELTFTEPQVGGGMGGQDQKGGVFGEKKEGATLGAGTGGTGQQIEVVAAIFPLHKALQSGTVQAGMPKEGMTDVIIFRPQMGGHDLQQGQEKPGGAYERNK